MGSLFFLEPHDAANFFGFFRSATHAFFDLLDEVVDVQDGIKVGLFGHSGDVGVEPFDPVGFRSLTEVGNSVSHYYVVSLHFEEVVFWVFRSCLPLDLFQVDNSSVDAGDEHTLGEQLGKSRDISH